MTAARFSCVQDGAMRGLGRRPGKWILWLGLLFLFGLSNVPAKAETLYTLSGWVEPASRPYTAYGEYVLRTDPLDRVRAILADPDNRFGKVVPARYRLKVAITQPRGPEDEPVFHIVAQETVASGSSSPEATGSPGWSGITNDLYDARMNVVPRIASISGEDFADADGDGVPDIRDSFPHRPEEWKDDDGDGTGNNADPDDDNDGMSDSYEILNGLNPFVADAAGDLDGDGASNGEEAAAGTRADDRSSVFALSFGFDPVDDRIAVYWQALTTRIYVLESAPSPAGPWSSVHAGFLPPIDGSFTFSFPSPASRRVFFRVTASTTP